MLAGFEPPQRFAERGEVVAANGRAHLSHGHDLTLQTWNPIHLRNATRPNNVLSSSAVPHNSTTISGAHSSFLGGNCDFWEIFLAHTRTRMHISYEADAAKWSRHDSPIGESPKGGRAAVGRHLRHYMQQARSASEPLAFAAEPSAVACCCLCNADPRCLENY